ncbi:MAG: hypothetical protein GC157_05485 [Frankiales bacterium]|nr:hypothetical protein [Frankiales bacterium]
MVVTRGRHRAGSAAAVLTAAAAVALAASLPLAPAAQAATRSAAPVQVGLFGSQDPTYDGVFRQSLALLAYAAAGTTPPADAVHWLLAQQCADGGFEAFRADPAAACSPSDPATYSGEDTNSTGMASVALRALGHGAEADRALGWALAAQRPDGGFPYFAGGDSDANSTAVVLFATGSAGRTPSAVASGGPSAADFLASLQIGCDGAATDDDGGFAFQDYGAGLTDNDAASVQATLALTGAALPLAAATVSTDVPRQTCTPAPVATSDSPAALGAGHIARVLDAFGGAIPQFDYSTGARRPGTVSAGDTAWAALSLAAAGVGRTQLDAAIATLTTATGLPAAGLASGSAAPSTASGSSTAAALAAPHARTATASSDEPGLLGVVALAAHAAGAASTTVDAAVTRIGATMRTAAATATPTPSGTTASPSPSASGTHASPNDDPGDAASLPPTGATPLTVPLGVGGLGLMGLGALVLAYGRRRGAHS